MATINASVSKDNSGNEVLVFKLHEPVNVPLTEENGVAQLKVVFRELLTMLAYGEDVTVEFAKNEEYGTNLFTQACEAYVEELNGELAQVKDDMAREGLIVAVEPADK